MELTISTETVFNEIRSLALSLTQKGFKPSDLHSVQVLVGPEADLHARGCPEVNQKAKHLRSLGSVLESPGLWHECITEAKLRSYGPRPSALKAFSSLIVPLREANDVSILNEYKGSSLASHVEALRKLVALDLLPSQHQRNGLMYGIYPLSAFNSSVRSSPVAALPGKIFAEITSSFYTELMAYKDMTAALGLDDYTSEVKSDAPFNWSSINVNAALSPLADPLPAGASFTDVFTKTIGSLTSAYLMQVAKEFEAATAEINAELKAVSQSFLL